MADQRIQATENMIGANHPTLSDTLNRLSLVQHNTDGTHKTITADDGTVGAPSHSFTTQTNKGLYHSAIDKLGVAIAGAKVGEFTTSGFDVTGALTVSNLNSGSISQSGGASKILATNLSGNLLIGTATDAGTKINVAGAVNIQGMTYCFGIAPYSAVGDPILFKNYSGTELARFDSSGNLLVGTISGSYHQIVKSVTANAGNGILNIGNGTYNIAQFYAVSVGGANAANATFKVGYDANTTRSINAGGTINASGADYAEYERKADNCGIVAKGQIIGFDANGHVVDTWLDAVTFGVKTTNPSYIGGDTWGSEDVVGKRPEQPAEDASQKEKDQYAIDLADFETRLEAQRQKVDRIAYSGKVPCNVTGANVGDYIIATQDGDGIKGIAVNNPTFEQYRCAVGRVRRILEDGRPEIAVIVH